MKSCRLCGREYDPSAKLEDPAQQAGLILAEEEYGDAAEICGDCLASRGRLAMMYRPDFYSG